MGYIENLRKFVGHMPIKIVGCCVLLLNERNQLFLQRRKDNNCWSYPGGTFEFGETVEECAIREVFEETGLRISNLQLYTISSGEKMHYIYPNGDEVNIVELLYVCKDYVGEIVDQEEEVFEQRFFDMDKIPENLDPFTSEIIIKFINDNIIDLYI